MAAWSIVLAIGDPHHRFLELKADRGRMHTGIANDGAASLPLQTVHIDLAP
jgi:hypothetical protein